MDYDTNGLVVLTSKSMRYYSSDLTRVWKKTRLLCTILAVKSIRTNGAVSGECGTYSNNVIQVRYRSDTTNLLMAYSIQADRRRILTRCQFR